MTWKPRPTTYRGSPDEILGRAEAIQARNPHRARRLVSSLGFVDLTATDGDTAAALRRIGRARAIMAATAEKSDTWRRKVGPMILALLAFAFFAAVAFAPN